MPAATAAADPDDDPPGVCAMAGVDRRTIFGREIGGVVDVLDADRQAAERQLRQPRALGQSPRRIDVEHDEGANLRLAFRDRLGAEVDDRARGERAGLDAAGEIERCEHQWDPSSRATIRSVRRRATGITKNAVPAATGQAMK